MSLLPLLTLLAAAPVTPGIETGVFTPPMVGSPGDAALLFANSRRAQLGLDPRSTLTVTGVFGTRFGGTVHLTQSVNGLLVAGRKVIVTFDASMRVVQVSSNAVNFSALELAPVISADQALALAAKEIEGAWLKADGTPWGGTKKLAFYVNGEAHLGFLCFVPTLKNSESWHVGVDATDGTVLFTTNRAWANDAAKVYASSPGAAGVPTAPTLNTTLTHLIPDAGRLTGDRVRALNCCPTANCDPDAGAARATGMTQTPMGAVSFDVAICDTKQRASNDPALHASGDWVYTPVDPPGTAAPSVNNPADWDEFAEVNAYYHVSKAYEGVRQLSVGPLARDGGFSPFTLRDAGIGADPMAAWVNVSDPDFQNAMPNPQGVYVSDTLSRTDNAMFLAREDMDLVLLPQQVLNSDALVIYQGQNADFAYDGPVLWHEFGHGVIHSTSNWDTIVSFDSRSSNNESSALNEGMADVISAMVGKHPVIGEYVGPRIDPTMSAIRDIDNTFKCPDVLWGESHQDSMHFTGAIWEARKQFLGTDDGDTFDAAIYAALVTFPPDVNFESAATLVTNAVVAAFPARADARTVVEGIFTARGVKGCSKVLDITSTLDTPRPYYGISGTAFAGVAQGSSVPGPYQFKIHAPNGMKSVTLSALMQTFGNNSRLELMGAVDRPITFAKNQTVLANDAMQKVVPAVSQGNVTGQLMINVPCGSDLYLAIGDTSTRDRQLFNVSFAFEQADSCPVVDAGMPDAGTMQQVVRLVGAPEELGPRSTGCGCNVTSPLAVIALGLWAARRRRHDGRR